MMMIPTPLPGVCILEPKVHGDARGFFFESYHAADLEALGIEGRFVQDNHSRSVRGTLRGLHYQLANPQAKLCRVILGAVLDVAVDLRRGSPHFGEWTSVVLSAQNRRQLYVPRGFAHGFLVLSESAEFLYKCDDFYAPGDEYALAWDDPQVGIRWELSAPPLLSEKDARAPRLAEIPKAHLFIYDDAAEPESRSGIEYEPRSPGGWLPGTRELGLTGAAALR
jgi:dTDP-4-dehydrorhamnose 3,5-epimerase